MKYSMPALFIIVLCTGACGAEEDSHNPDATQTESSATTGDNTEESSEHTDTTDNDSEWPGSSATSCGSPDQGLEPVDCTMHGDTDAFCVYSNHCYCNIDAGFQCEAPLMGEDMAECAPGSTCVPIE